MQFYYGTDFDGKGFPCLVSCDDADNKTVDAGAKINKSSVCFVKFGWRDVQFLLGENSVLEISGWRIESLARQREKAPLLRR